MIPQSVEFKLIAAVEKEHFDEVPALLAEYSAQIAQMDSPPEQHVKDLMDWIHRALSTSRAHAVDQFQLLSDARPYSTSKRDRKTIQVTG